MTKNRFILSTALFLIFGLPGLQAQRAMPSTGGTISGNGGSMSYSAGQVASATKTGVNGSVVEGVLQPFEISLLTGLEEAEGINLLVSAYPNPTNGILILRSETQELATLNFQLYDMGGKLMYGSKITTTETKIAMNSLTTGTYFLKVTRGSKEIKTFKIRKN